MKCIHCQRDSKFKERSDGRCPGCRRRFAFEPRKGDPMTDGVFHAAIERVSANGSVRFNTDHLYYDVRRRHVCRPPPPASAFIAAFFAIVLSIVAQSGWLALVLLSGIAAAYAWLRAERITPWRKLSRDDFERLLRRYIQAHGQLPGLIERRTRSSQPAVNPQEMLAYSFDRAVICDRPETVDVLIANQFHFENNCAVLAVDGYPPHAFEIVRAMLRNNPRLIVVALHDASIAGCQLAHRLRSDPAWFKDGVQVLDAGLRPVHRKALRGQQERLRPRRVVASGSGVSSEEAAWLSGNMLALAVVLPEQIIKRLFRAINLVEERQDERPGGDSRSDADGDSGGGSGGNTGDGGRSDRNDRDLQLDTDADLSDGGGDSFG